MLPFGRMVFVAVTDSACHRFSLPITDYHNIHLLCSLRVHRILIYSHFRPFSKLQDFFSYHHKHHHHPRRRLFTTSVFQSHEHRRSVRSSNEVWKWRTPPWFDHYISPVEKNLTTYLWFWLLPLMTSDYHCSLPKFTPWCISFLILSQLEILIPCKTLNKDNILVKAWKKKHVWCLFNDHKNSIKYSTQTFK